MLRNGRTGHTWHLVVDHIMLVMKMRSSSPGNRLVGLYRGFMCMYKKQKQKQKKKTKKKKKKWLVTAGCLRQLVKAGCKWLSSKKKKKKKKNGKKKQKVVLIGSIQLPRGTVCRGGTFDCRGALGKHVRGGVWMSCLLRFYVCWIIEMYTGERNMYMLLKRV